MVWNGNQQAEDYRWEVWLPVERSNSRINEGRRAKKTLERRLKIVVDFFKFLNYNDKN